MKFTSDGAVLTPNGNTSIWRYMSHDKFEKLLSDSALYFANAMQLTDRYEIAIPQSTLDAVATQHMRASGDTAAVTDAVLRFYGENDPGKQGVFLCCWSAFPHEQYALWKIYLDMKPDGVAVRSSVSGLRRALSLTDSADDWPYYIGKVAYKKFMQSHEINRMSIVTTKKPFYTFEQELRAFFFDDKPAARRKSSASTPRGRKVDVRLDALIQGVYVSPFARPEYREMIEEMLRRRGLPTRLVRNSEIREVWR